MYGGSVTRTSRRRLALSGSTSLLLAACVCTSLVAQAAPGDPDPTLLSASYEMGYQIGDSGTFRADADDQVVEGDVDRPLNNSVTTTDGDVASTNNRIRISSAQQAGALSSATVRADIDGSATESSTGSPPSAVSDASARFDFNVTEEVAYSITPSVSASTNDSTNACATAIVSLRQIDTAVSSYTLTSQAEPRCSDIPNDGSTTGTLPAGRYRITAVATGGVEATGESVMYTSSAAATITFGTGGSDAPPLCEGEQVTIDAGDSSRNEIFGTAGRDVINGLGENDFIVGIGGNDRLCGSGGDDTLTGGDGTDRLFGAGGRDDLFGRDQRDFLFGASGGDRELDGGPGKDFINAGGGADKKVFGRGGKDELKGGGGNDVLRGNGGNDELSGGPGVNDKCIGGSGVDKADESCEIVKSIELLPLEPL
jgi:Ca2+-binding RTX toxin-like protein